MNKKLRVALLTNSSVLPAWADSALRQVSESGHAELALIILDQPEYGAQKPLKLLWQERRHWLYRVFSAMDRKLFLHGPDPLEPKVLEHSFPGIPVLEVRRTSDREAGIWEESDLESIRNFELDIIVSLGLDHFPASALSAARFGIWEYRFSDERILRGGPPGFWEVVLGLPVTGCSIFMHSCEPGGSRTLCRSSFFTYTLSPARNSAYFFWAASPLLARQVERLYSMGKQSFFQKGDDSESEFDFYDGRYYEVPSNLAMLKYLGILLRRLFAETWRRFFSPDQWFLLFDLGNSAQGSLGRFQKLMPPVDRFWADPHVVCKDNRFFIFMEEFLYESGRGHISVIEMDEQGRCAPATRVLEAAYHFSYPFVFEWQHTYYMIPESSENGTIDLYECTEFPANWRHALTLMDNVKAVDTTLLHYQGKWWLFTAMTQNPNAFPQMELFLFYSDELLTADWHPHPMNPIVSDTRSARPAGQIFIRDGRIFRPSQVCTSTYGESINLNEILVLSETDYVEKQVTSIKPDWDERVHATHTYASEDRLTIVDACRKRPRFS